jgi:UDP-N-acetylmuramoyl-L-alanyl-D-glutamate--2,6-diaminopimelate ligase
VSGKNSPTNRSMIQLLAAAGLNDDGLVSCDSADVGIGSLSCDSRDVKPGSCFVAVSGSRDDGARYVDEVVRHGAKVVVFDRRCAVPKGVGSIEVRDAHTALSRLAAAFYGFGVGQPSEHFQLIGVTGTNGKTTTSVLTQAILRFGGVRTALLGTIQYDLVGEIVSAPWTTPPPLELYRYLSMAAKSGATHAVMEVSSHGLAQSRCDGHRFCVGVFTNLSGEHLDYHGTYAKYASAKRRLFASLDGEALAVVNGDDSMSSFMVSEGRSRVVRFGMGAGSAIRAEKVELSAMGSRFVLRVGGERVRVCMKLVGLHNIANALAAVGVAREMGFDLPAIRDGLESAEAVPGRLQRVTKTADPFSVFVDYAHTDDALKHALDTLKAMTAGRVICVFGCGGDRDRTKRGRMGRVASERSDLVVLTSDNPRGEAPMAIIDDILTGMNGPKGCDVEVEPDRRRAIELAVEIAREEDCVLIAGKGHEDYQIVGEVRIPFDDVEIARAVVHGRMGSGS